MPVMQKSLLGSKRLRPNRLFSNFKGLDVLAKVPQEIGADEYNVILGMGRQALIAAGAAQNFTQNAPRDLIIRRMTLSEATSAIVGVGSDFSVTAITIEGNATLLGGAAPGSTFHPNSVYPPCFDLPVAGGTPVTVTVVNNNAAARDCELSFNID